LIYHKFVLFIEFKYIFLTMQLKLNPYKSSRSSFLTVIVKIIAVCLVLVFALFLIDKVNFPSPKNEIKKDITNEIKKLK